MKQAIRRYYAYSLFANMWFIAAILVPFFTQWGHISLLQVQLLQSWYSLWFFILDVPTGVIADKIGRKYALTLGAIVAASGLILYGLIPNFWYFLAAEFLVALGSSLMSGANQAFLYETLKEHKQENESKKYFGHGSSFELMGIFIGGITGGLIAAHFGLNMPFIVSAVPLLIAGSIALTFREPKGQKKQLEKEHLLTTVKKGYTFLLHHKILRLMALDSLVVGTVAYFTFWLYQPMLLKAGVAIAIFGVYEGISTVTQMLVSRHFVFLEKLFGSAQNYLRFSALATAAGFLLVALHPNAFTILLFLVLGRGIGLTRATLLSSYMQKFIPSEQRATVTSSVTTFNRVTIAIMNPLIGLMATHSLYLAAGLLGLLPLTLFLFSPIEQEMLE